MAEITFPAVPFNGGTVALTVETGSMCQLTQGGKFVSVFQQKNPSALIATVVQVTNPKSVNPTVTTVRQQVLKDAPAESVGFDHIRVWRLADTRILVGVKAQGVLRSYFDVYNVDAVTGEITRLTTTSVTSVALNLLVGERASSFELKNDVVVYCPARTNPSESLTISKFEFDPVSNVLTNSNISTSAAVISYSTGGYSRPSFSRKPGTTDEAVLVVSSAASQRLTTDSYVVRLATVTATSAVVKAFTQMPNQTVLKTGGMVSDGVAVFTDGIDYAEVDFSTATVKNQSRFQGAVPTAINSYPVPADFVHLAQDYFAVVGTARSSDSQGEIASSALYLRVVKYTDLNYAECAPGTANNTNGMVLPTCLGWCLDKPLVSLWGSDVLVAMGLKSATEFTLRTVWF